MSLRDRTLSLVPIFFVAAIWGYGLYHVYTNHDFYRADTWLMFNRYDALMIVMPLGLAFLLFVAVASLAGYFEKKKHG